MSIVIYFLAFTFILAGIFDDSLGEIWGENRSEVYEPYLLGIFWMLCAIYLRQRETKE